MLTVRLSSLSLNRTLIHLKQPKLLPFRNYHQNTSLKEEATQEYQEKGNDIETFEDDIEDPLRITGMRKDGKFYFSSWKLSASTGESHDLYLTFRDIQGNIVGPVKYVVDEFFLHLIVCINSSVFDWICW